MICKISPIELSWWFSFLWLSQNVKNNHYRFSFCIWMLSKMVFFYRNFFFTGKWSTAIFSFEKFISGDISYSKVIVDGLFLQKSHQSCAVFKEKSSAMTFSSRKFIIDDSFLQKNCEKNYFLIKCHKIVSFL